jgi:hypothetical protein
MLNDEFMTSTNAAEQALAADGAIARFSSNSVPCCLNADRAPQLKRNVMPRTEV